jgi:hypothetical protein
MTADPTHVASLLEDLCVRYGFSMPVRDVGRFVAAVAQGPDFFAETVLRAEGLEPNLEGRLLREVRDVVAARFHHWSSRDR